MARKKTHKQEKPKTENANIDLLNIFNVKPGRSVCMTEAASMAADDNVRNSKKAESSRTKTAIHRIRKKDNE